MNESIYKRRVKVQYGGLVVSLNGTGMRGMPDYMVLQEGGKVIFVEVKCGSKLSRLQEVMINKLRQMGFKVDVMEYKKKIINKYDS